MTSSDDDRLSGDIRVAEESVQRHLSRLDSHRMMFSPDEDWLLKDCRHQAGLADAVAELELLLRCATVRRRHQLAELSAAA